MNEDDDDLPVLTQILRTGVADRTDTRSRARPFAVDALDPRKVADAPWLTDQLDIGHAPTHEIEPYLNPSFDVVLPAFPDERPDANEATEEPRPSDAFGLSQDHDAPQALGIAYDEPEYSVDPPADTPAEVQVEAPREDPTVFAERVRDAVLDTLGTRIDTELDARVAQAIRVEVETALAQLQANLRTHLAEALKDVVGRAVDEEIARLGVLRVTDRA